MTAPANNYLFPPFVGAFGSPSGLFAPMGRVTLTSGAPFMTAPAAAQTAILLSPRCIVPVWNGSGFIFTDTLGELTQATTDSTKSPAAVAASSTYDMFVWTDLNGVVRHTRGPAWTNGTTRACALVNLNGVWVNGAAITSGPAIYQGTFTGTVQSNAASSIDWILGTAASGGGMASLNVWNTYNRKQVATRVVDSGVAYAYTTATVRQARASAANQINYVAGLAEDSITAAYQQDATLIAAVASKVFIGVGDDSVTGFETLPGTLYTNVAVAITSEFNTIYQKGIGEPMIGPHYVAALEKGDGTNANTFNYSQLGELSFSFMM